MNERITLPPETVERPTGGVVELHWAGLFGGIAVAVGTWVLLTTLGLAFGLSAFDAKDSMSAVRNFGIGTGIWTIVVSMVSLFAGGVVAARTSGILDRPSGAIHGAVLWSLATILSVVLVGSVVRSAAVGMVQTAGVAVGAAAHGAGDVGAALGIDAKDLIAPLNERLRSEGKPEMTPAQLQAALQSATGTRREPSATDRRA
ncbi:MAG: hypothetical protein JST00_14205 [Deltaproteobacteria bacterium]|nr:hypothetical protein [Deltaproteobacteria bacterium]